MNMSPPLPHSKLTRRIQPEELHLQDDDPRPSTVTSWLPHSTSGFRGSGVYCDELEDMYQRK